MHGLHEVEVYWIMCVQNNTQHDSKQLQRLQCQQQLAGIHYSISFPIAFSTSLDGSVIEMKLAAPIPVDNEVSLKA